jgi:hypothetical protein
MTHPNSAKKKWDLYSHFSALKITKRSFQLKFFFVKGIEKVFWEDIKLKYLKPNHLYCTTSIMN